MNKLNEFTSHPDRWYVNHYHCKDCDEFWQMEWDADCDDKCPKCHSAYTPYKSEEFNEERPEVEIKDVKCKYLKDQQEVFCDGVMLYYNKDKKRFELGEIVHDGMTWINGVMVNIEWDKQGKPFIQEEE